MLTNEIYLNRIEELENAVERLLECFERFSDYSNERPLIEVEIDMGSEPSMVSGISIIDGQVNQTTADAIEFANEVLYREVEEWGGVEED